MAKVLVLDDQMTMMQAVGEVLRAEGHQVMPFTNPAAALEALENVRPELVILSPMLERNRLLGTKVLLQARTVTPPALVLMIIPSGGADLAVEVMKRGAYDYLSRPFTLDELKLRVQRALAYRVAVAENVTLKKQLHSQPHLNQIIGVSPRLQAAAKLVQRLGECDHPVLVCGPAGSGKQLIARSIHFSSQRRFGPFLSFNCRTVPEHLVEAELFGEKRGPNGLDDKTGLLKDAAGGSVLLREIGVLPLLVQKRLVRLLYDRDRTGAHDLDADIIDVRVIAASNEPLESRVAAGSFSGELFRSVVEQTVSLPSLRERTEDIPLLVAHFLSAKVHPRTGKLYSMAPDALETCRAYAWPGNVRELETALDQACAGAVDETVRLWDLPRNLQAPADSATLPANGEGHHPARLHSSAKDGRGRASASVPSFDTALDIQAGDLVPLKKFLRDQELNYLQRILAHVDGSKEKAAELLGISLATMYRKLSEPAASASHEDLNSFDVHGLSPASQLQPAS